MAVLVAGAAEQLEVVELVAAAGVQRDAVVDLEAAGGAAADADAVALVDAGADLAPRPAVADLPSRLPVVVPSRAGVADPGWASSTRTRPRGSATPAPPSSGARSTSGTWEQVETIPEELHSRFAAIPVVLLGTGPRPEELFALERRDLDLDNSVLSVERV